MYFSLFFKLRNMYDNFFSPALIFLIKLCRSERDYGDLKNNAGHEIMYLCRQRDVTFLLATSVNSSGRARGTSAAMHMHRCTCDCRESRKVAKSLIAVSYLKV